MKIDNVSAFVVAIALGCLAVPVSAWSAVAPQPVFACALGKKMVSVTADGPQLSYKFGTRSHVEMSLIGSSQKKNVFYRADRYAGMEHQLRFVNGPYSYTVYNMEGNSQTGVSPSSGLVVMKGTTVVANMSCTRYAEFGVGFDYDTLPQDTEKYSAM